ncbi:MAG: GAF domain-containing protein [Deltaproteobacteria bacterium]|nr:MAG: GAF domain-containing protein [Deltaproteobacteria bacterium]
MRCAKAPERYGATRSRTRHAQLGIHRRIRASAARDGLGRGENAVSGHRRQRRVPPRRRRGIVARSTARSCLEYRAADRRYWEIRASPVDHEGSPALLYVGSDVTARERERRRLERASDRLAELTAFTAAGLLNPERLTDALVDTAASVSHGFAAVYVGAAAEPLRRVAARGLRADHREIMPETLTPGRFRSVRSVLTDGGTRVFPYSPALPSDERTLVRGMHWLAIVPIGTGHRSIGVLLAVARGSALGLLRDDVRLLEWCAEQLGFAIEHGELFRGIDHERAELALVLEQIPDAVVITDPDGRIVRENPAARQLLERADTADPAAATASPDGAGLGALPGTLGDLGITRALAGETVRGALGVVGGGRAEATWVVSSAAPLRAADGSLTGAVAVATDVTQHRRVEESLRVLAETSAVLAGSLDYHGTLPAVAELLVPRVADVCAIDVAADGSAARLAFACDESIGESVRALRDVPLPDATAAADGVARLTESVDAEALGALAADVRQLECLQALGLRSSLVVPIAARGRHYGVLWLATAQSLRRYDATTQALAEDLAHRIATAIDNARLYQAAQEADRRKDEFLAMLSHELRTPLAPIMAWMQILKRAGDPERIRAAVDVVERNVRLQTALIDDLLDLSERKRRRRRSSSPASCPTNPSSSRATPTACSRWSGTCSRTRSSSRARTRPCRCRSRRTRAPRCCACAIAAPASRPSSCRTCSTCSGSRSAARAAATADSASVSRSPSA